jgi:hypothetical protein
VEGHVLGLSVDAHDGVCRLVGIMRSPSRARPGRFGGPVLDGHTLAMPGKGLTLEAAAEPGERPALPEQVDTSKVPQL